MSASRVDPNFRPNMSPAEFAAEWPDLDPHATLRDFIDHHLDKGSTSWDWQAKFRGFCNYRRDKARNEQRQALDGQDTLGFPLDPVKRAAMMQRRAGPQPGDARYFNLAFWNERVEHHLSAGLSVEQAHKQADEDHASEFPIREESNR